MKVLRNWRLWTVVDVALAGLYFWQGVLWAGFLFVGIAVLNTSLGVHGERVGATPGAVYPVQMSDEGQRVDLRKGSVEPVETPSDAAPAAGDWLAEHRDNCPVCKARSEEK
ncbi:hypothetical protein ACFWPU_00625 [Streptomyces sp. NPDC058471]|uniref:hypothetical protein n=1 Tax=Streptomyces sp. NPDC058471 TaxID=3346516 RepID=UPI003648A2EB